MFTVDIGEFEITLKKTNVFDKAKELEQRRYQMNDRCDDLPDRTRLIDGKTDGFESLFQLLIITFIIDLWHFRTFALIDIIVLVGSEVKAVLLKIRFSAQELIERMKVSLSWLLFDDT